MEIEGLKKSIIKPREEEVKFDVTHLAKNMLKCEKCTRTFYDFDTEKIWYLVNCCHCVCRACLVKYIYSEYPRSKGDLKCIMDKCSQIFSEEDFRVKNKNKFISPMYGKVKREKLMYLPKFL
jgi:hypothetical protein